MEWLLGISIVVNILFALIIAAAIYNVVTAQNEAHHNHEQWAKWENRWYEAQALVHKEFNCHISPSGLPTEMKITKLGSRAGEHQC